MGHLIPAGTGIGKYDRIEIQVEAEDDEEFTFAEEASEPVEQQPLSAMRDEAE
jgi:hypothetical protein